VSNEPKWGLHVSSKVVAVVAKLRCTAIKTKVSGGERWGGTGSLRESDNGLAERIKRLGKEEEHALFIFKSMCRKAEKATLLDSGMIKKLE
jgi:hypothetical protein